MTVMKRRKFTSKFKTKVVLEALCERYTLAQLAERHQLHPNQISQWKSQFLSNAESVFDDGAKSSKDQAKEEKDKLLKVIGQQKVQIDSCLPAVSRQVLKDALR